MFLDSFEPEKVINFISSKIKHFFIQYPNFKLFLLKLQFFRNILFEKTKEEINDFYLTNILPLIRNKSNYNEIEKNLFEISNNEKIIKSRYYKIIWEEYINLFIIGLKISLNETLNTKNTEYIHKCNNCINCKERELYKCKYGKIETIEKEIINQYKENDYNDKNYFKFSSINDKIYFQDKNLPYEEKENQIINFQFDNNINYLIKNNNNNYEIFKDSFIFESLIKNEIENNKNKKINNNIKNIKLNTSISNRRSKHEQKNNNSLRKQKLKEFQFKFTKRENVDKKIMRKFRKFLKEKSKKNNKEIIDILSNSKFWIDFITENLLPPFNYSTEKKEFKSFNTTYMSWVFEHKFSFELYNIFIKLSIKSLCKHFQFIYHLNEENQEFNQLKIYLNNLPLIFTLSNYKQSIKRNSIDFEFDSKKEYDDEENNIFSNENKSFNYLKGNDIFNDLIKDRM